MENIIIIEKLHRDFKVPIRREGLKGSIRDLFSRKYEIVKAVNDLTIKIPKGEIIGLLGANGAGKSTTIKMMIGIIRPTSGKIEINGRNPYEEQSIYLKDIGVVFGQRTQLWWNLPVRESFRILKQIYEISDSDYEENMRLFNDNVGFDNIINKTVRQLSLGQRILCDILIAFLHNPSIVFLDEPTIGLDVSMKFRIHNLIKELNRRKNTTVVLTTHDMSDVDALCNRVILMNKGCSIYDDSIDKLVKFFGDYKTLHLKYSNADEIYLEEISLKIEAHFRDSSDMEISHDENEIEILVDERSCSVVSVINDLQKFIRIQNIIVSELSTEEIVRKIYEDGISNVV